MHPSSVRVCVSPPAKAKVTGTTTGRAIALTVVSVFVLTFGCSCASAADPSFTSVATERFREDADYIVANAFDLYRGQQKFNDLAKRRRQAWEAGEEAGDPMAKYLMGMIHTIAPDGRRDLQRAMRLFSEAAANGVPHAQVMIGEMIERDAPEITVALYKKAAEQDFGWAQYKLGCAYGEGRLVTLDQRRAFELILLSAQNGVTAGQTDVGARYEYGKGTTMDQQEAFRWYQAAAAQGDAIGLMSVGACQMLGIGTPVDHEQAERHLRQAVELGEPLARQYLSALLDWKAVYTKTLATEAQQYDPNDLTTWAADSQYRELEYQRRENAMFGR